MVVESTGRDDYPAIQQALRDVGSRHRYQGPGIPTTGGCIQLEGHYRVSKPLVSGDPEDSNVNCVGIVSVGGFLIEYTGPRTDKPLLSMYGNTVGGKGGECRDILSNAKFCGNNQCRGVLLKNQFHFHGVRGLHIERTRQLALDVDTCWKSYLDDIHITRITGCALRMKTCDSMRVSNMRVGSVWGIWHRSDGDIPHVPHSQPAASKALWLYEMEHGETAARQQFGGDYCEDWPDEIAVAKRATILLNTQDQRFGSVMIEQCGMGDRPLIYCDKERSKNITFEHLYLQDNYNRTCKVYIQSHSSDGAGDTKNFTFDVVRCSEAVGSARCQSYIRCGGTTKPHMSTVRVRDIDAAGLGKSIIHCTSPGRYYGFSVDHARTDNRIPRANWITADQGAELIEECPLGLNHR